MKTTFIFFICINIFVISLYCQQPNFLPLHIGNEYQMYDGYEYQFGKIERDTVYPNGKTYFHLPSPFDFEDCRVDSAGNVLSISRPFFGGPPSPEEYMLFKADAVLDEVWPIAWDFNPVIDTGYGKCIYVDSVYLFGKTRLVKGVLIFDESYYYYYFFLAEGLGLVREQYDDGTTSLLNYAKINGIVYGTFVNIESEILPLNEFTVSQNYPNPFNSSTNIEVTIPNQISNEELKFSVYNILGVKVFEEDFPIAENIQIRFNTDQLNLSSGTYFYSVTYGSQKLTKKFLLLK